MKTKKSYNKTRKKSNKTRKKLSNSKTKKQFHILPESNKTIWSSDYFGQREVIDLTSWKIKNYVDNLNPISGKFKGKIADEYGRRLKIQLKKHKPSRKKFFNKTKKKYNIKSIDNVLDNMPNKMVETTYKDILLSEKSKKQN